MFQAENSTRGPRHKRIYAAYELAYTVADFSAGMLFLIGSILFFYKQFENPAIWCFVLGSALFVMKPTLRLMREIHYLLIGDVEDVARKVAD